MSSHLTEKLAEFVFEELPMPEMAEGRRHLAECSDCREQVEQFQSTHAMLRTSVDVEPPRRIMLEFEKPRVASWMRRWLAPMAASAAVALAVVTFVPRPQPQIVELANELKKQSAAQEKEILRVRGELALLDSYQRATERETIDNGSSIQLLARGYPR
jgi:anti-sigma factor RsiW